MFTMYTILEKAAYVQEAGDIFFTVRHRLKMLRDPCVILYNKKYSTLT